MSLPSKKQPSSLYPQTRVTQYIRDWWDREQRDLAKVADPDEGMQTGHGTVFDLVPLISSQRAVDLVLDLEPVLGYEIPDSVIKRGGYHSCDEMVEHLNGKLAYLHSQEQAA